MYVGIFCTSDSIYHFCSIYLHPFNYQFHIYQSQIERIYYIFITGVLVVTYPMIPILWPSLSTIADGEMYCPNSSFTSVKSQLAHTIGKVSFFKNGRKPSKLSSNS